MAGSRLPVVVQAPVLPEEGADVPRDVSRRRQFQPVVATLLTTAAELAPVLIRLARRVRVAGPRAGRRTAFADSAEVHYSECRIALTHQGRYVVFHRTSLVSLSKSEGARAGWLLRGLGLGVAGFASAVVLQRMRLGGGKHGLRMPPR